MKDLNQSSANDFGLLDLLEKADLVEGENGSKNETEKSFQDQKESLGDDDVVPSTFVNLKKADVENFDLTFDQENDLKADGNNRKRKSMLKIILLDFFFIPVILLMFFPNNYSYCYRKLYWRWSHFTEKTVGIKFKIQV